MRFWIILSLLLSPALLRATDANLSMKQQEGKQTETLDEQIDKLQKLKEYYEVSIKRANRTAWRLEFRDPGYSRQLDQKVEYYKQQLDQVNKELDAKLQQKKKMGS